MTSPWTRKFAATAIVVSAALALPAAAADPIKLGIVAEVSGPNAEAGSYTVAATCNFDVDSPDSNDYVATATAGQPGYQTMKWTTVGNVSVMTGNTATVAVP